MKKFHFIALVVCTGFLWACHKDGPTENPFADAPWAIDETLPVPIQMGAPGTDTKANAITSLTGVKLKVLAYDQNKALMLGKELSAVGTADAIQFKTDDYSDNSTYYYPYHNPSTQQEMSNYTFYAYHIPGITTTEGGAFVSNSYKVSFPFNPASANEDVLVASAAATDYVLSSPIYSGPDINDNTKPVRYAAATYYGFNGRYQRITRLKEVQATYLPALYFVHAAAKIVLVVKAADDAAATSFTSSNLTVKLNTILQSGAKAKAVLNVSDASAVTSANYQTYSGTLLAWDSESAAAAPYVMDNNAAPAATPTTVGVRLHADDGLFIMPGSGAVTITYTISGDNTQANIAPMQATLVVPDGGYLPGRTYTYNVIVDSNEAVSISAFLAGWIDGSFGGGQNPDINN